MEKIKEDCSNVSLNSSNKEKYRCLVCDYQTSDDRNYNKHLKTEKHIKNMNGNNENYSYKCEACNQYLRDKEKVQTHCNKLSHKQNVIEKYPDTCKVGSGIESNGKWLLDPRLNLSMKHKYIIKLNAMNNKISVKDKKTNIIEKNKPINIEKEFEDEIININTKDYVEYYYLSDNKKEKLLNDAIKWMQQNNINPEDEGYSEPNELNDNYISIYNIFSDNTIKYFKNLGVYVKNIC